MKKLFTSILLLISISVAFAQSIEFTDSINISRERWRDSLLRMDKRNTYWVFVRIFFGWHRPIQI